MHISLYGDKQMSKTKIAIALVAIAALTLVLVGLASAQIAANQPITGATTGTAAPNGGFLGWIGNCFGLRNSQPSAGQYVAPQAPADGSVPTAAPYQGGYGYGPCWAR